MSETSDLQQGDAQLQGDPSFKRSCSTLSNGGVCTRGAQLKSPSMLTGAAMGLDVPVAVPTEQLRELECAACGELVQNPVYASCGHSFCQRHLNSGAEDDELDRMAAMMRRLCVELRFSPSRAREALAASPRDLARAEELCRQASSIEGRAVRVRPSVREPQFRWGAVTHSSVGRLARVDDGHAHVDFPQQSRWHCLLSEIEVEGTADQVQVGAMVRVRHGVQPTMGWGVLEGDTAGEVVQVSQARVIVQGSSAMWYGFVGELEQAPTPEAATGDAALHAILDRLSSSSPSELCVASLGSVLGAAARGEEGSCTVMLRGDRRRAIMNTHGAMDVLRQAGFQIMKWDVYRTRTLLESRAENTPALAQHVLSHLEARLGPCPSLSGEDDMRYAVVVTVDAAEAKKAPFETYWAETLRPKLMVALAPPQSRWTWARKGWENEDQLRQHLQDHMLNGPTAVARGQTRRDSKQISSSLEAQGLSVSIIKEGPVSGESPALGEDPVEVWFDKAWQGDIAKGARVRLMNVPDDHALAGTTSIGVVGSQYVSSRDGLTYIVNFPRAVTKHVEAKYLMLDFEAELIQPGVRVKLRAGIDPQFGWQGVESSDIGTVHAVQFDGTVLVYIPGIEELFVATCHELDTEDLPRLVKGNCPVCHEPLLRGEHLATDIVVEAQLRRLRRLMAGERTERNDMIGNVKGASNDSGPPLLRTKTHLGEMTCSICLDLMVAPVTLACGHSFCKAHIEAWLLQHQHCPNCKHRVLPERLHRRQIQAPRAALFEIELHDDDRRGEGQGAGAVAAAAAAAAATRRAQAENWPEIPVNRMLESQVVRYFPQELETRTLEMATEVWEDLQQRSSGYLARLRAFMRQCDAQAIQQLVDVGLADIDVKLPGTRGGTLLMLAAEQGLEGATRELLQRGADPLNAAQTTADVGITALSLAAARGSCGPLELLLAATEWPAARLADALAAAIEQRKGDCMQRILQHSEGVVHFANSFGFPALLTAVQTNNSQVVPLLLECKAELESTLTSGLFVSGAGIAKTNGSYQIVGEFEGKPYYQNGSGAVMFCKGWWKIAGQRSGLGKVWYYSMPEPRTETAEPPPGLWTTFGCDNSVVNPMPAPAVRSLGGESGPTLTPLMLAVQLGFVEVATRLLEGGADPKSQCQSTGEGMLQLACSAGDLGMVRTLLAFQASPTCLDAQQRAPLPAACSAGHHLVVAELLRASAPADSEELPTPLMLATCCGNYPPGPGRLWQATVADKYSLVVAELLDAKADASRCTPDGSSVLHLAAKAGASAKALESLLASGARADVTDGEGRTPFFAALLAGRSAAACTLMKHLGPLETIMGFQYKGFTPLSAAALLGDSQLISDMLGILHMQGDNTMQRWLQAPGAATQGDSQRCMRLTSDGLENNIWQLVYEPLGAPQPSEQQPIQVGDRVMLSSEYASEGHASKGPLKPGDVGLVVKKDFGKVPYQVKFKERLFWYREGALRRYKVEPPPFGSVWRGTFSHPYINSTRVTGIHVEMDTPEGGHWHFMDRTEAITLERNGERDVCIREPHQGGMELQGHLDETGYIKGQVIKEDHRSGSFLLVPSEQDATVRCPRGHAAERMSCYSSRTATCDVCSRTISHEEPLFFTCQACNYDVCSACCGGSLLAHLPRELPIHLGSWAPLHFAAAAGHRETVHALLQAAADPCAKDCLGRTPLHLAAASGHGWAVEELLGCQSSWPLADIPDLHGYLPIAFAPAEMLRFTFASDGALCGQAIEVGRAAAGAPGEPGAAGVYRVEGLRDGRPCYRRVAGPGWAVCWDAQTSRWGLYQERYDAGCIQYQSRENTPRCPVSGWVPVVAPEPAPVFEEVLPWRAGCCLIAATPEASRPKRHEIKKVVEALPQSRGQIQELTVRVQSGPEGISITLPPGAPPLEVLIQEMIRTGDLPPERPSGCLQQ